MRKLLVLLLFVSSASATDNYLNIPWGTSLEEISRTYGLQPLENELLVKSNKLWLSEEVRGDFQIMLATVDGELASRTVEDMEMIATVFGFFKEKLVYVILGTDVLDYNESTENKYKKLVDSLQPDDCDLKWKVVFKTEDPGGSIFNDGGYIGLCETESTYFEYQQGLGTVMNPTHLQYHAFFMDKVFFDALSESKDYLMDEDLKKQIPSQLTFTRFITKKSAETTRGQKKKN